MSAELTYQRAMESLARSIGLAETQADAQANSNIRSGNQSLADKSSTSCAGHGDVPADSVPAAPSSSTPVVTPSTEPSIQPKAQQTQLDSSIAHYLSVISPQPESARNETSSPAVQLGAQATVSRPNGCLCS